jgi:hypothetical protein
MSETKDTQEEENFFAQETKLWKGFWVFETMFFLLALLFFVGALVTVARFDPDRHYYSTNPAFDAMAYMIAGSPFLMGLIGFFAYCVWDSRHRAIDQCRYIAEKYSIQMNPEDAHDLGVCLYAGEVFEQFYLLIKNRRPELIPEGFLEGSGGENWTAYRRLVMALWNRYVEKADQDAAEEEASTSEALATS